MAGIKCLGNMMRSTSRFSNKMCPGICRNFGKDIMQSKRKLCSAAYLTWNSDVLSPKFTKKSVIKFNYSAPVTLGCMPLIKPLLMETLDHSSSGDMLECISNDDDSDTWSLSWITE